MVVAGFRVESVRLVTTPTMIYMDLRLGRHIRQAWDPGLGGIPPSLGRAGTPRYQAHRLGMDHSVERHTFRQVQQAVGLHWFQEVVGSAVQLLAL